MSNYQENNGVNVNTADVIVSVDSDVDNITTLISGIALSSSSSPPPPPPPPTPRPTAEDTTGLDILAAGAAFEYNMIAMAAVVAADPVSFALPSLAAPASAPSPPPSLVSSLAPARSLVSAPAPAPRLNITYNNRLIHGVKCQRCPETANAAFDHFTTVNKRGERKQICRKCLGKDKETKARKKQRDLEEGKKKGKRKRGEEDDDDEWTGGGASGLVV